MTEEAFVARVTCKCGRKIRVLKHKGRRDEFKDWRCNTCKTIGEKAARISQLNLMQKSGKVKYE